MAKVRALHPSRFPGLVLILFLFVLSAAIGVEAGDANADRRDSEAAPSPDRNGLFVGASFGRGSIDVNCENCGDRPPIKEALSVAAHIGFMLTPRFGLLAEHWSVRYNARGGAWFDDSVEHLVAQHTSAVAAQFFVTNSLWLKAGLGVGWHITDEDYGKKPPGPAAVPMFASNTSTASGPGEMETGRAARSPASFAAIGWELAHNSVFAAEIQLRVGTSRRADDLYQVYTTGINVGCSLY